MTTEILKNTPWIHFCCSEKLWASSGGDRPRDIPPQRAKKAAPEVLPVLWGVGEGRDDVLLDEEEHGEEKSQPHGTHHRPNGQGLHRGQHKQAVRGVVVKFGHCKEKGKDVRRHLLTKPWMFYPHHEVLGSKQERRCDALACGSLGAMEDGSIWLFGLFFSSIHLWLGCHPDRTDHC